MQINFGAVLLAIVLAIVFIAVLWWVLSKLYQRSTSELVCASSSVANCPTAPPRSSHAGEPAQASRR